MKKILILMGRYLPGHKDGGPLRTIVNLTEALGDEYQFYIACLDRDNGDTEAYPDIQRNKWNRVGKAKVWYVAPKGFTDRVLLGLAKGMDFIYLCSFFDDYGYKTLLLKKRNKISCPVAVASMGVFSEGALAQKALKKKVFIAGCKSLGLFSDITWSVTSEIEADDIKRVIGKNIKYIVAEDLPRTNVPGFVQKGETFSVAFLSRISPKKNLLTAIKILQHVYCTMNFYIYGPTEDMDYWNKCKKELEKLPENVTWYYKGDVPSENVQEELAKHDVFLFPTLGENYGHVIFEALSVGCIPIISDRTPWIIIKNQNAGYVLSLDNLKDFSDAIDKVCNMNENTRNEMQNRGIKIALSKVEENRKETGYRTIFG